MRTARRGSARAGSGRPSPPAPLDVRQARVVAIDLLSRKAWTRRELGARLRRRGAAPEVADAVVADLEARGYVDDRAFARSWADSRARGRALGSRRLREELVARGVARPLVEEAVREAFAETDEAGQARAAAARRLPLLRRAAPDQAARRLGAYLLRRGFPGDIVRRIVRESCGVAVPTD